MEMEHKKTAEKVAKLLLELKAVTLSPDRPYTYTSGSKGPIYCDNRLILSYPDKRKEIIRAFAAMAKEKFNNFDIVAGKETAGIAHAALLAEEMGKPMIYVRSEAKDHGKQNQIEGKLEKGQKVLVIQDLINTGGSSVNAVNALKDAGAEVVACKAIFTYSMPKAEQLFTDADCPLHALSDFNTLVEQAVSTGYIDEMQKKTLLEWHADPKAWSEKFN